MNPCPPRAPAGLRRPASALGCRTEHRSRTCFCCAGAARRGRSGRPEHPLREAGPEPAHAVLQVQSDEEAEDTGEAERQGAEEALRLPQADSEVDLFRVHQPGQRDERERQRHDQRDQRDDPGGERHRELEEEEGDALPQRGRGEKRPQPGEWAVRDRVRLAIRNMGAEQMDRQLTLEAGGAPGGEEGRQQHPESDPDEGERHAGRDPDRQSDEIDEPQRKAEPEVEEAAVSPRPHRDSEEIGPGELPG